jgi:type IV pilus assembly protein PilB
MYDQEFFNHEMADIDLNNINVSSNDLMLLSIDIMQKYCIVPIEINKDYALIAMSNPENKDVIRKVEILIKKKIRTMPAKQNQIYSLIKILEDIKSTELILEGLKGKEDKDVLPQYETFDGNLNVGIENSPTVVISNRIINAAINSKASDIHIEPYDDIVIVRYRVDGILYDKLVVPKGAYLSVCARIKIQAGISIAEKRIPQDGKFQFLSEDEYYDLRVSTLPTMYGEKIVIRILYKQEKLMSLESLGFYILGACDIIESLKNSHGIILVTGPTGSGKTTTLYSMLSELDNLHKNIITIEDPVEIALKRVNQVSVNVKAGLTFASGLRSILRQDPDVILIGEIRDEETAQIAIRAAVTGHLVISTLHTNDAVSSITRLVDMGVPSYLVADSIIACIAQRLVRKICDYCKIQYTPNSNEQKTLNIDSDTKLYKGKGCIFCNNTGYKHRTVVYEMMRVNSDVKDLINRGKGSEKIRLYNRNSRMKSIVDNCKELVKLGITTYEEFINLGNCNY